VLHNLKANKVLWNLSVGLTLIVAIIGVTVPNIYDKVMDPKLIPGGYAQDLLTIFICLIMFYVISKTKENDSKKQIVIFGIIWSFWYLYGIFSIEQIYNWAYYLYLAIFSITTWAMIYFLMNLKKDILEKISIPNTMRKISAWTSITIAVLFNFLWISSLVPLIKESNRIEFLYSIYILDLCFIMPAFIITAIMALQKKALGIVLAPVMFIMGFFVIFPLSLGEIAKPFYDQSADFKAMIMSFILSGLFLVLTILHLKKLKVK
jgi:hypothetical protein